MEININQHVLSTDNLQAAFNKDLASRNPKDNFIEHKFESQEKSYYYLHFSCQVPDAMNKIKKSTIG